MRTKFVFMALLCSLSLSGQAKNPAALRYDIECAGNGVQGTYLVKVWVYGKPDNITSNEINKCAVHGIIFKGFEEKNDCKGQKPLAQSPDLEQEEADFFNAFFNIDQSYAKYVTEVEGTAERVKLGKEYKIGAIVSVSKDLLRKDLETAGIIRGLSDGF